MNRIRERSRRGNDATTSGAVTPHWHLQTALYLVGPPLAYRKVRRHALRCAEYDAGRAAYGAVGVSAHLCSSAGRRYNHSGGAASPHSSSDCIPASVKSERPSDVRAAATEMVQADSSGPADGSTRDGRGPGWRRTRAGSLMVMEKNVTAVVAVPVAERHRAACVQSM